MLQTSYNFWMDIQTIFTLHRRIDIKIYLINVSNIDEI